MRCKLTQRQRQVLAGAQRRAKGRLAAKRFGFLSRKVLAQLLRREHPLYDDFLRMRASCDSRNRQKPRVDRARAAPRRRSETRRIARQLELALAWLNHGGSAEITPEGHIRLRQTWAERPAGVKRRQRW